jgi:hypothetical protein
MKNIYVCFDVLLQLFINVLSFLKFNCVNPLKTKGNLFYVRTQLVPRSKQSPPRL